MYRVDWLQGSSPLARGKRLHLHFYSDGGRLIPARAGKTPSVRAFMFIGSAHPRSRGENEYLKRRSFISPGSSPLARGKPERNSLAIRDARLIPARAGKTA